MPRGDRTGPAGMGAMTGRGAGYCAGYSVPGYVNPAGGRGYGFGFGRGSGWGRGGRGYRNRFYAAAAPGRQVPGEVYPQWSNGNLPTKNQEIEMLKNQSRFLEEELTGITKRLREMESEKPEK